MDKRLKEIIIERLLEDINEWDTDTVYRTLKVYHEEALGKASDQELLEEAEYVFLDIDELKEIVEEERNNIETVRGDP